MSSARDTKIHSNIVAASEFGAAQSQIYGTPLVLFHHSPSPLEEGNRRQTEKMKQGASQQTATGLVMTLSSLKS